MQIKSTKNISDDIIVYRNEEHAQQIHENTLAETVKTLHENGLAVRQDKCETNGPSIEYNGMIFNKKL